MNKTVYISNEMHRVAKVAAAQANTTIGKYVGGLIRQAAALGVNASESPIASQPSPGDPATARRKETPND